MKRSPVLSGILGLSLLGSAVAAARPTALPGRGGPVACLQRAAAQAEDLDPALARSWLGRVRAAAALPSLTVRVGRGTGGWYATRDLQGVEHYTLTTSDAWRFDVGATWSLDRLLFDRNELRLSREARRAGKGRRLLLTRVAELYFARRRLELMPADGAGISEGPPDAPLERKLQIEKLNAILDGLTGGALSSGACGKEAESMSRRPK